MVSAASACGGALARAFACMVFRLSEGRRFGRESAEELASSFANSWLTECYSAITTRFLLVAADQLEHRSRIVAAKSQVELVQIGDRGGDIQTEPATGNGVAAFDAIKALEDLVAFSRLDTY